MVPHAHAVMPAAASMMHTVTVMPASPVILSIAMVAGTHVGLPVPWLASLRIRLRRSTGKGPDQRRGQHTRRQYC
jgi:hypothetical protein